MRKQVIAAAVAAALAFSGALAQQPRKSARPEVVDATIMVRSVDPQSHTVTFRGPRGSMHTVRLSPDVDLSNLKPGDRFKVRYFEPVAINVMRGAEPTASAGASAPQAVEVDLVTPPDAPRPGSMVARAERASGMVESIDYKTRHMSVRRPQGETLVVKVAEDIDLAKLNVGDPVTLDYTETVAMEMIPQPPPAPVGG